MMFAIPYLGKHSEESPNNEMTQVEN